MKKIKCALIGYGYWGHILESYLVNNEHYDLKYIYDPVLTPNWNIKKIFELYEIEAVFLCTPIDTHYGLAKDFLNRDVHVFCEKPLAKKLKEVQDLICIAQKRKRCLYTDYIYTVSRTINYMKQEMSHIGKIKCIKGVLSQFGNFYPNDSIYEILGVHLFSVLVYLLGDKIRDAKVLYETVIHRETNGSPLETFFSLGFPDQLKAYLECSLVSDEKRREFKLIGSEGIISFNMLNNPTFSETILKKEKNGYSIKTSKQLNYDEKNNLALVLDDFYHKICHQESGNVKLSENVAFLLDLVNT